MMHRTLSLSVFLLVILLGGCAVVEQTQGIEGVWFFEGEKGYSERILFSDEGQIEWSRYQDGDVIFSRCGSYSAETNWYSKKERRYVADRSDGHWKNFYDTVLTPVLTMEFDSLLDEGEKERFVLQYLIAGNALYLIDNSSTMYIRVEEDVESTGEEIDE